MFGSCNNTPFSMPVAPISYGNNGGFGGSWGDDWIALIIFAMLFGYGGYGFGGGFGNGFGGGFMPWLFGGVNGGVADNYVLSSDFANIERKIDGVNNGLCDGFYAVNTAFGNLNNTLATNFASVQNTLTQGFAGLNTGMVTQGYENRLATQGLQAQLASCCCDIREGIQANTTQGVLNTNAVQQQIAAAQAENDKSAMQNRFDMAQYNCSTLQAIDKVGDRIIDYLAADKAQALRDENQALRLAASQSAQNNYLIGQLRPSPIPAYTVQNPYCNCGYANYGCGCN